MTRVQRVGRVKTLDFDRGLNVEQKVTLLRSYSELLGSTGFGPRTASWNLYAPHAPESG